MAVGNAIVQSATFKPLSIDEWSAPLAEYAKQHIAADEVLTKLDEEAGDYERYLMSNPNSQAAQRYNEYISAIDAQAQDLAEHGITPQSRNNLLNLRRQYAGTIKPIKNSIALYQDIMEQRSKDASKDYILGAPDISVEYLMEHPEYTKEMDKQTYKTGTQIYKDAKDRFGGLNQFDNTTIPYPAEDGSYTTYVTPQSYSSEEMAAAINAVFHGGDSSNIHQELLQTIEDLKTQYNYDNMSVYEQEAFESFIKRAAATSIKDPKTSTRVTPRGRTSSSTSNKPFYYVQTKEGVTLINQGTNWYTEEDGKLVPATGTYTINGETVHLSLGKNKTSSKSETPKDTKTKYFQTTGVNLPSKEACTHPTSYGYEAMLFKTFYERQDQNAIAKKYKDSADAKMRERGFTDKDLKGKESQYIEIYVKWDEKHKHIISSICKVKNLNYQAQPASLNGAQS